MIQYKFKHPPEKEKGEFECPYCKKPYFTRSSLSGHVGGKHRKDITTKTKKPYCKFCDNELVVGKNWPNWAIKQQNLICQKCKRKQNRESYHKKRRKKEKNMEAFHHRLKVMAENKKAREERLL